jgi:hypothetical protein
METRERNYIIFNDLKSQPVYYGFYLAEIFILVFMILVAIPIYLNMKINIFICLMPSGMYGIFLFKYDGTDNLWKQFKTEFIYFFLEIKTFLKGE